MTPKSPTSFRGRLQPPQKPPAMHLPPKTRRTSIHFLSYASLPEKNRTDTTGMTPDPADALSAACSSCSSSGPTSADGNSCLFTVSSNGQPKARTHDCHSCHPTPPRRVRTGHSFTFSAFRHRESTLTSRACKLHFPVPASLHTVFPCPRQTHPAYQTTAEDCTKSAKTDSMQSLPRQEPKDCNPLRKASAASVPIFYPSRSLTPASPGITERRISPSHPRTRRQQKRRRNQLVYVALTYSLTSPRKVILHERSTTYFLTMRTRVHNS